MLRIEAVAARFPGLAVAELSGWVARRWVCPVADETGALVFAEVDLARVGLIVDLRVTLEVEEELVPMVLSLLDQLHAERRRLHAVLEAVRGQPAAVQDAVRAALARVR